ncbi:MAG TPA: biotin--[acetyl-CoA-carboxylase] ligase [Xanthomonadaceae bacterium]|nr:biotin--[acetyl-CoA-carboxylase] ligase [Xanthomonadaceae bacterium]
MHERGLLEQLEEGPVSGDVLARRAGVTRAAIWKRIDALRAAGVEIDAAPGHGYRLRQPLTLLDAATIECALSAAARRELAALEVAWTLDSTNSALLRRGPPESGTDVLFAECQTEGRGRRGRGWASPLAGHVSLSLARRFAGGLSRLGGLSLVAGVAAAGALRDLGVRDIGLKWPNDLVVRDGHGLRKLGGILVEGGGEHAGPAHAVIGIGVNVRLPHAAGAAIDQPWIDLAGCLDGARGGAIDRNAVAAALLGRILPALAGFDRQGLAPFLGPYARLDVLAGREVVVRDGSREHVGLACGLAADGGLSLALPSGQVRVFHAGEASVRSR